MSWLKWKQEQDRRKSLFIITNPVTIILCVFTFLILLLPVLSWILR